VTPDFVRAIILPSRSQGRPGRQWAGAAWVSCSASVSLPVPGSAIGVSVQTGGNNLSPSAAPCPCNMDHGAHKQVDLVERRPSARFAISSFQGHARKGSRGRAGNILGRVATASLNQRSDASS